MRTDKERFDLCIHDLAYQVTNSAVFSQNPLDVVRDSSWGYDPVSMASGAAHSQFAQTAFNADETKFNEEMKSRLISCLLLVEPGGSATEKSCILKFTR